MATDSVMSLFMDPNQLAQQRSAAVNQRAAQFAQMDPMAQSQYNIYRGASNLGTGVASMLGVEDPQMKLQSLRQQVLQSVDRNDPKALSEAAQVLNQAGDIQGAQALYQAAQARQKDVQEAEVKQSQITRNLRERPDRPASMSELAKLQGERDDIIREFGANDPRVKEINALIAKKTTGGGIGSEIAAGLSPLLGAMAGAQAKKAAEAGGTDVGKKIADIEGSQSALIAIQGAKGIFNKGIYAGKYGPTMENLSGYSEGVIGSKERLANTETFRSYLGDVVIPGLKDFGGSDTVEELKYLQAVYAGDTTAQPKALKNMLDRAESKITSKINRIRAQQTAIQTGQPLPTGPSTTGAPKATRRFNMQTGKFETIPQ
jgi:hypothetical protein